MEIKKLLSATIHGGWEPIFALEGIPYKSETVIDIKYLKNPNHSWTKAILRLYSLECWLYKVLNSVAL